MGHGVARLSRAVPRRAITHLKENNICLQLFTSILESFREDFLLATQAHIVLFPYFLYPISQVAITGSIFMTVAIAWERYVAVHYPLDYNQAMNDVNAIRKRLVKYVGPCLILAFLFNIMKFFEANVRY